VTLTPPIRTITPVLHNLCPKCAERIRRGSKVVYATLPDCECTFPVPKCKTWFDEKRKRPVVAYSRLQREMDLEFLEQYEQLTCSVALANGLITGFQCQAQERRIARMREKCKGMALAAMSSSADREADKP
jgi:hypothetical protein